LKNLVRPVRIYRARPAIVGRSFYDLSANIQPKALAIAGNPAVILVDDEPYQRQIISEFLARHGLRPTAVGTAGELKRLAQQSMPDVVLLDVHLGEAENGFDLARWLRARSSRIGIIMLTAAGETLDRVLGLESGADDYVTKPFEPAELLARVRAQLRRARDTMPPPSRQTQVRVGAAMLDLERRILILRDGSEDELAASEFDLLKIFIENPNRTLARDWLLEATSHREAEPSTERSTTGSCACAARSNMIQASRRRSALFVGLAIASYRHPTDPANGTQGASGPGGGRHVCPQGRPGRGWCAPPLASR